MTQTILLTGATDGIGKLAAHKLAALGHTLLLHGRSEAKLNTLVESLKAVPGAGTIAGYRADLSSFDDVSTLANQVASDHTRIDVLINNAGVLHTSTPRTPDGLDVRFVVNTLSPYLLTQRLMPRFHERSRIVNLSSAAQSPVDMAALTGESPINDDLAAYAQSKLAITMWSCGADLPENHPTMIALNPGSMLGSKMVKEGFGVVGRDIDIGADIIVQAALSDEFANAHRQYYDNDSGRFTHPHPDALDQDKCAAMIAAIKALLVQHGQPVS